MNNIINLLEFRGTNSTLFTGRPQGKQVRKKLKLDKIDLTDKTITFIIPKGTTSFNPSFYLGLLFESIQKFGIEKFDKKYFFTFEDSDNDRVIKVLSENLNDGRRSAINEIEDNTNFNQFYN